MDIKFLIIQFIGLIGYVLLSYSYFKKKKKDILLIQIFSYIMFILHYQFLGAITGSVCNLLGLLSFLIIYLFDVLKKNKKISFFSLFTFDDKEYIVATFLAILEMAKNRELTIKQEDLFGDITVESVV